MRTVATLSVAGLMVLGLSACAAEATPPEPKATYDSVVDLRDAFVDAGGECDDWVQGNRITNAAQSGDCSSSTVLSIYLSEATRDETVTNLKSISIAGVHLLVGENWIINVEDPESYRDALGGTVVTS